MKHELAWLSRRNGSRSKE